MLKIFATSLLTYNFPVNPQDVAPVKYLRLQWSRSLKLSGGISINTQSLTFGSILLVKPLWNANLALLFLLRFITRLGLYKITFESVGIIEYKKLSLDDIDMYQAAQNYVRDVFGTFSINESEVGNFAYFVTYVDLELIKISLYFSFRFSLVATLTSRGKNSKGAH